MDAIQKQLVNTDSIPAINLRKERNEVFKQINETEKIMINIQETSRKAVENVRAGMTSWEVEKVAGRYRSKDFGLNNLMCENYGNVWVIYRNGLVIGFINADKFRTCWDVK